ASVVSTYCGAEKPIALVARACPPVEHTSATASVAPSGARLRRADRITAPPSAEISAGRDLAGGRNLQACRYLIVCEERADELVERRAIAAGERRRRHRSHRGGPRDVHRERNLAEVVAGTQHTARPERFLGDREHPGEDDEEPVGVVALADDRGPRRELLPPHPRGQQRERLAGQLGEQRDARELVGKPRL